MLMLVGGRGVGDGRVVRCWSCWDGVGINPGEFVIFVKSKDVGKEAILLIVVSASHVRDVLDLAR